MTTRTRKRLHIGFAVFFAVQIPVALLTDLKNSVPYLVFLSLWALVASHLSGASAEIPTEKPEDEETP
jgi:hypothetical protein